VPHRNRMMAALPGPIGSPVIAVTAVTSMARYPLYFGSVHRFSLRSKPRVTSGAPQRFAHIAAVLVVAVSAAARCTAAVCAAVHPTLTRPVAGADLHAAPDLVLASDGYVPVTILNSGAFFRFSYRSAASCQSSIARRGGF
jgi:hypothetical protein